jgi:ABC-type glutathione transport system ATPase component
MKIERFFCERLNGYLNFDLTFYQDVSFLIGINGSGKTSVLKAIMALLGPDVDWLMNAKYTTIRVHLRNDGKRIIITSNRDEKSLKFEFSENDTISLYKLTDDEYSASLRRSEDFVRDEDGELIRIRELRSELPDKIKPSYRCGSYQPLSFLAWIERAFPQGRRHRHGRAAFPLLGELTPPFELSLMRASDRLKPLRWTRCGKPISCDLAMPID